MLLQDSVELDSFDAIGTMVDGMTKPLEIPTLESAKWQDVIDALQEMEAGFFASSAGPSGAPWAPLAPYTVKKKNSTIILRETDELIGSLSATNGSSIRKINADSIDFGTNRAWAWVHQDGGSKIPQREFLGISDEGMTDVLDIVADAAVEMMFGK